MFHCLFIVLKIPLFSIPIPDAKVALAECQLVYYSVPCRFKWCFHTTKQSLTIFLIPHEPLLKVDANVEAQYSEYHGDVPCSVAELIDSV